MGNSATVVKMGEPTGDIALIGKYIFIALIGKYIFIAPIGKYINCSYW